MVGWDKFVMKRLLMCFSVFQKNMYLAEDRILCFELVAKRNCNWLLRCMFCAISEDLSY